MPKRPFPVTELLTPVTHEAGGKTPNPAIQVIKTEDAYCKVSIEPLPRGFGLTIAYPLRRVLLSSINGSAITWIKIDGLDGENADLPIVKEELDELLLNISRIRIQSQSERAGKMRLNVKGEGPVCAGDISTSSDFEIVNPELHLATLHSDDSQLSMEFNVEQGGGYQPAAPNVRISNPPVGILPVDAVFNPVCKVKFNIERTSVGLITDFERLVMEVWTDETINAAEAFHQAAYRLTDHFFMFANLAPNFPGPPLHIYQTPIENLGLSPTTLVSLRRVRISKAGELVEMSDEDLLKIRNFGKKSLVELKEKLIEHGITKIPDSDSPLTDFAPEPLYKTEAEFREGLSVWVRMDPSAVSGIYRKGVVTCVFRRMAVTKSDGKRALGERQYIVKFEDDDIGEMKIFERQLEYRQMFLSV